MNILRLSILIGLFAITGSFAPPVNADCPHRANFNHKHCDDPVGGNGDDTDPALYIAEWDGAVEGNSGGPDGGPHPGMDEDRNWIAGNKKSIGLNIGGGTPSDMRNVGQLTDLRYFTELIRNPGPFGAEGTNCFGGGVDGFLGQASLIKGRKGRAEAHFWFLAYPRVGPVPMTDRISYLLTLIGESPTVTNPIVGDWFPTTGTTTMTMDTWELSTQGVADDVSCSGSGDLGDFGGSPVVVDVCLVGSGEPNCPVL